MTQGPDGAIQQRDKQTWAIVPRTPLGLVTAEDLERIAAVARRFSIPTIKITSGQRIALIGFTAEQVPLAWQELGMPVGRASELCYHYVQACPGIALCRFGMRDSLDLGKRLDEVFTGQPMPAKAKLGISGCPFSCAEGWVRDFGAFAKKSGWTVMVGGSSGHKPRLADVIAEDLTEDDTVALARRYFDHYRSNGKPRERTARFVERAGIDAIRGAIL